jgi:hypothetical protein
LYSPHLRRDRVSFDPDIFDFLESLGKGTVLWDRLPIKAGKGILVVRRAASFLLGCAFFSITLLPVAAVFKGIEVADIEFVCEFGDKRWSTFSYCFPVEPSKKLVGFYLRDGQSVLPGAQHAQN